MQCALSEYLKRLKKYNLTLFEFISLIRNILTMQTKWREDEKMKWKGESKIERL